MPPDQRAPVLYSAQPLRRAVSRSCIQYLQRGAIARNRPVEHRPSRQRECCLRASHHEQFPRCGDRPAQARFGVTVQQSISAVVKHEMYTEHAHPTRTGSNPSSPSFPASSCAFICCRKLPFSIQSTTMHIVPGITSSATPRNGRICSWDRPVHRSDSRKNACQTLQHQRRVSLSRRRQ